MLTDKQKAILDLNGKCTVRSCPGSGKTFSISHKLGKEISQWSSRNRGVAVLSFTNIACDEISEKYSLLCNDEAISYPHFLGTLDSFIVQNIFLPFGYLIIDSTEKPSVIADFSKGIISFSQKVWKAQCHSNRCNIMDFYFDEKGILQDTRGILTRCNIANKPCQKVKEVFYKKGQATYNDVVNVSIRVLKRYPDLAKLLAARYPYIIIDEAQDISKEQMKIFDLLIANGLKNIILVGDSDQAIYEWRNAEPQIFIDKCIDSGWNHITINENFRSSQKICNATKIFSTLDSISKAVGFEAKYEYKPTVIKYDQNDVETLISKFINICNENDVKMENAAILTRGKAGIGMPDYSAIENMWQNELTEYLAIATNYKINNNNKKQYEAIEKVLYHLIIDPDFKNDIDLEKIIQVINISDWKKIIYDIMISMPEKDVVLKDWEISIKHTIEEVCSKYNLTFKLALEIKTKVRVNKNELKDFKTQSLDVFFQRKFDNEYVQTTIHGVKGCTFEAVLLIIKQRGKLTSNVLNNHQINSEEIRTAYVAMTRAKKILVVAIPNSVNNNTLVRFPTTEWNFITL